MRKRNRIIMLVIFIILILIAAKDLLIGQNSMFNNKNKENSPDWYMTDSHGFNTNDTGDLKSQLNSPDLKHYTANNAISIVQPHFIVYSSSKIPWRITANHGTYFQNKPDYLRLTGNVIVKQLPAPGSKLTELHTSLLFYYPATDIAKTKKPVVVKQQDSIIHAVGMVANLKTSVINFLSKSHAEYHTTSNKKQPSAHTTVHIRSNSSGSK